MSHTILNSHCFQLITINYYMCVGERDIVNCLLIFQILKCIVHAIFAIPGTSIAGMREREAYRFKEVFEFKS